MIQKIDRCFTVLGITIGVAALISIPAKAESPAAVKLDILTDRSAGITVACVDKVLEIPGKRYEWRDANGETVVKIDSVKVAVATAIRSFKGVEAGQRFAYIAQTWRGYSGAVVVGETALFFLDRYQEGTLGLYPLFAEEVKKQLPIVPLFQIAMSGYGRRSVMRHDKLDYRKATRPGTNPKGGWGLGLIINVPSSNTIAHPNPLPYPNPNLKLEQVLLPLADAEAEIARLVKAGAAPSPKPTKQ